MRPNMSNIQKYLIHLNCVLKKFVNLSKVPSLFSSFALTNYGHTILIIRLNFNLYSIQLMCVCFVSYIKNTLFTFITNDMFYLHDIF